MSHVESARYLYRTGLFLLALAAVSLLMTACGDASAQQKREQLTREEMSYLDEWAPRLVEAWLEFPSSGPEAVDSLLRASGSSSDELEALIEMCESNPEAAYPYLYEKLAEEASAIEPPPPDCPAGDPVVEEESEEGQEVEEQEESR